MTVRYLRWAPMVAAGVLLSAPILATGQQAPKSRSPAPTPATPAHQHHGTPEGWKFSWPKRDPAKGRQIFAKLGCYSCHELQGRALPGAEGQCNDRLGAVASMGPMHDVDYFAESIINPSAVIEKGKGYAAADGSYKMPSFNDSMTVQELVDLIAFFTSDGEVLFGKKQDGDGRKH